MTRITPGRVESVLQRKKPRIFRESERWWNISISGAFAEFRWRKVDNLEVAWLDAHASDFCRQRNSRRKL